MKIYVISIDHTYANRKISHNKHDFFYLSIKTNWTAFVIISKRFVYFLFYFQFSCVYLSLRYLFDANCRLVSSIEVWRWKLCANLFARLFFCWLNGKMEILVQKWVNFYGLPLHAQRPLWVDISQWALATANCKMWSISSQSLLNRLLNYTNV